MRRPDFYRLLNPPEQQLLIRVFGNTLPPWIEIGIGNGLGLGGAPWTSTTNDAGFRQTPNVRYVLNVGALASYDLSTPLGTSGVLGDSYGTRRGLLVHEMTHVWQYKLGENLVFGKIWAETIGSYDYTPGEPWDRYNTEQQATIVENWVDSGMSESSELFPYIQEVVRKGLKPGERFRRVPPADFELYRNGVQPLPASTLKVVIYAPEKPMEEELAKRFQASDIKGFTARLEKLKGLFSNVPPKQANDLLQRLKVYNVTDKLSKYFREHLSTFERETLLNLLRTVATQAS